MKTYIIKASNGVEVIDSTPEAEIRIINMEYAEERILKQIEERKQTERKQKLLYRFIHKIACTCGIIQKMNHKGDKT